MSKFSRQTVCSSYEAKVDLYREMHSRGDPKFTSEYIFPNQKEDAFIITDKFYKNPNLRALSIVKRTKVGMDGLMIEIAKNMSTHPDDDFLMDYRNILMITGMSNIAWEKDMKEKIPECFVNNVYHHGKLKSKLLEKSLVELKNGVIIVDEIDTGDKVCNDVYQILAQILDKYNLLDINNLKENNIRFVFVSATMEKQLNQLKKWDEGVHEMYKMTIPDSYISHGDLLKLNIIKEFYPIDSFEKADKWIKEDIISNYGNDYRIHIIRITQKHIQHLKDAATANNIQIRDFNSKDNIEYEELKDIFDSIHTTNKHIILIVKGFYRRATLIPNPWKIKIGAVHENFTKSTDVNVQIQGLPGRMTGYWKETILQGHKTGPYRTSIEAIEEYEKWFLDPEGYNGQYRTNVHKDTFVNPKYITGITRQDLPESKNKDKEYKIFETQDQAIKYVKENLNIQLRKRNNDKAPEELRKNDTNPSYKELIERFWGISSKNKVRMIPTDENKWCVYWRPSLLNIE